MNNTFAHLLQIANLTFQACKFWCVRRTASIFFLTPDIYVNIY